MGLFSKKKKITAKDMAMQMMLASVDVIGTLKCFNDVDDIHSMAVNTGYFYGFLRLQLNSITNLDVANKIIENSIDYLEEAINGKASFENFGYKVKSMANNATAHMQYSLKELKDNPFMGMGMFYLMDLDQSNKVNVDRMDIAEENMKKLYGIVAKLTEDIKIV